MYLVTGEEFLSLVKANVMWFYFTIFCLISVQISNVQLLHEIGICLLDCCSVNVWFASWIIFRMQLKNNNDVNIGVNTVQILSFSWEKKYILEIFEIACNDTREYSHDMEMYLLPY